MRLQDYTDYQKHMQLMKHSRVSQNERTHLNHYKRVHDLLKSYSKRNSLIEFRKHALTAQTKHNYQLELDRIRGELSRKLIPATTREMLLAREKKNKLYELGAKAINHIDEL